jgi:chromate reductase
MKILGISGSLRGDSHNTRLLEAAATATPSGVELVLWSALREVPPFDEDVEAGPAPLVVRQLREEVTAADAVLLATPEYNASVPGQLKNALDWASRPYATNPFRGKPAAVVSASPGPTGGASAQADLRRILARMGARVVEAGLVLPRADARLEVEDDEELVSALRWVVEELAAEATSSPAAAAA